MTPLSPSGNPIWFDLLHLSKSGDSTNFDPDKNFVVGKNGSERLIEIPNDEDTRCRDLIVYRKLFITAKDYSRPEPARFSCRRIYVLGPSPTFHQVDVKCEYILQIKMTQLSETLGKLAGKAPLPESKSRKKTAPNPPMFALGTYIGGESSDNAGLLLAVMHGHTDVAQLLVHAGANIHVRDSHGRTPLMCAAMQGQEELVRLLIIKGADAVEALVFAAKNGDLVMAQQLVNAGVLVDAGYDDWSSLIYAAEHGHGPVVRFLIDRGADATEAIIFAVHHGSIAMVKSLLDAGVPAQTKNRHGNTLPMMAAKSGRTEMVRWLLGDWRSRFSSEEGPGIPGGLDDLLNPPVPSPDPVLPQPMQGDSTEPPKKWPVLPRPAQRDPQRKTAVHAPVQILPRSMGGYSTKPPLGPVPPRPAQGHPGRKAAVHTPARSLPRPLQQDAARTPLGPVPPKPAQGHPGRKAAVHAPARSLPQPLQQDAARTPLGPVPPRPAAKHPQPKTAVPPSGTARPRPRRGDATRPPRIPVSPRPAQEHPYRKTAVPSPGTIQFLSRRVDPTRPPHRIPRTTR